MDTSSYDHRRTSTLEDPDVVHAPMRDRCPVAHSDEYGGFWVLTRYEDVHAATRDTTTYSSLPTVTLPPVGAPKPFIPVESDPPEHQKYRSLLNPVFSARRIEGLEPRIRAAAVELIDRFAGAGEADLAQQLGFPLTAQVLTWFLGIPPEDVERFRTWSLGLITVGAPDEELALQMEIRDYYLALIRDRATNPTGDLASQLLAATIDDRPVTEDEVLDLYLTLTGAGAETTASAANHTFVLLDRHPEIRKELTADPSLIPGAVEELLRYITPVPGFRRTVTQAVEVEGVQLAKGDLVWLSWLSANHDERVFPDADQLDIHRESNRHLAFGAGVHRCPGAPLARLQLRVMLEELLARVPEYRVVDPESIVIEQGQSRVIRSVPVTFATSGR